MVGYWFWQARGRWVPRLWAGMAAAAGLAYFGWRWAFYGQLLPNTFYVKFGNLDAGYAWLEETVAVFAPLLLLTAVLVFRRGTRAAGLLLLATVAFTYGTYAVSGPTMDYVHRFAFHAFPVLCLGAGLGAAALDRRWLKVSAAALTVAWTGLAGLLHTGLPVVANYGHDLHRAHVPIGEGLAAAEVPAESRTLAVSDAGAIPYFSGWETIDYIGLNDEAIAHGADPTDVVREANPTVIVVTAAGPRIPPVVYGMRVGEATAGYVHVAQARMRENYWQHVFALPEWAPQVGTAVTTSVERAQRTYDPGRYGLTFDRWLDRLRGQLPGT
ncbi:hypothetical protein [Qaidamihabitans albus]|uniref:hypothetical protein n=1 Tax=Qaidamihabitans albus TaxID=2795733 RepID=UPI0018F12F42|nr:hypothetical protein [Qaidamihabitans albus]